MSLTVLSIAFPFAPVGPQSVGGSETILACLDQALVDRGHNSLVIACEGSRIAGELIELPLPDSGNITDEQKLWHTKRLNAVIQQVISRHRIDLVHIHSMDFHQLSIPASVSTVVSLHLPTSWYPAEVWNRYRNMDRFQFCCVSESQRSTCPEHLRNSPVIGNGVEIPSAYDAAPRDNFALVLGRICPEKNAHAALEAGTLADTPVLLGGKVFPYAEHQAYFDEKIKPLLDSAPPHSFLGPLSPAKKQALLSRAKCLLHPTLAEETSSLVAMEALASGTPVIAYRSGALPEIVEHGVTGFLVGSVPEMSEAIRQIHTISSDVCRQRAAERFNKDRMVSQYLDLYQDLVQRRRQRNYA